MFSAALAIQVLLATAAFAIPSSRERLARRVAQRQGNVNQLISVETLGNVTHATSSNWAGAVLNEPAGTFRSVTGTFTVPTPSEPSGGGSGSHSASAWVGIDGDSCQTAIVQTGIDFTISNGRVSFDAWSEFFPAPSVDFSGFSIAAGQQIRLTATVTSTTAGTLQIENLTTGKSVSRSVTSSSRLCQQDAEWIVEDFEEGSSLVPFASFTPVTFTDVSASTSSGGSDTPAGAVLIDLVQNGKTLATASASSNSVTVSHS